jgi:hypothetical protein
MKPKELAKLLEVVVRKVVRDELKPIITEVVKASKPVEQSRVKQPSAKKSGVSLFEVLGEEKQKPQTKFSDDAMLNGILNETANDGEWRNLDGNPYTSQQAQGFNRAQMAEMIGYGNGVATAQTMAPMTGPDGEPINTNIEGTAVGDALTRDYSALMKTINAKKGK